MSQLLAVHIRSAFPRLGDLGDASIFRASVKDVLLSKKSDKILIMLS